jgi:hypothetical protein
MAVDIDDALLRLERSLARLCNGRAVETMQIGQLDCSAVTGTDIGTLGLKRP